MTGDRATPARSGPTWDPRRVSRASIILAIVRKDLVEFSRDRLWMILTPLTLVLFAIVFWLLPATVEESITVGIAPASLAFVLEGLGGVGEAAEGLRIVPFESAEELASAIESGSPVAVGDRQERVAIGLAFPEGFALRMLAGQPTTVNVYLDADVPTELRGAMTSAVREMSYAISGAPLPVTLPDQDQIVLGVDRAGAQVPMRERVRPMLAFFVLLVESMALASLLAAEVASRTITAVAATPARVADLVIAKGLTGTLLAFSQAVVLLLVTRSFDQNAHVLLAAVLLGAVLMAGMALLAGSAGRDFMGTLFLGVLFLVPLMVPAFAVLLPGTASAWVQALPSYGIVQAIVGAASYGQGFAELSGHFLTAALWTAAIFALGWLALGRKVASL